MVVGRKGGPLALQIILPKTSLKNGFLWILNCHFMNVLAK